jgi:hypothetical protein
MDTIADFILQHPEIIRHQPQIAAGINQAKAVFLDRLAEGIQQGAPTGFQVRLRPDMGRQSFGQHDNGALIITPPPASPLPACVTAQQVSPAIPRSLPTQRTSGPPSPNTDAIGCFSRMRA